MRFSNPIFDAIKPLCLLQIRSEHSGGATRGGSAAGECVQRSARLLAMGNPQRATDAFGRHCDTARMSEAHDARQVQPGADADFQDAPFGRTDHSLAIGQHVHVAHRQIREPRQDNVIVEAHTLASQIAVLAVSSGRRRNALSSLGVKGRRVRPKAANTMTTL